jgi:anti-anti-sigma factor
MISFEGQKKEDVFLFQLSGRLDSSNSHEVEVFLMSRIEAGETNIIGNLTNLCYLSSSGIRVLVMAAKSLNEKKGAMALFGMQDNIRELFDLVELPRVIPTFDTEEDALQLF